MLDQIYVQISLALNMIETNLFVLLKEEVNVVKVMYIIITGIYLLTASMQYHVLFTLSLVVMHQFT